MPPRSPSSLLSQRGASRDEAWKHEVDQRLARLEEMLRPWKRLKKFAMDKGDSESTVRRDAKAGLVELKRSNLRQRRSRSVGIDQIQAPAAAP